MLREHLGLFSVLIRRSNDLAVVIDVVPFGVKVVAIAEYVINSDDAVAIAVAKLPRLNPSFCSQPLT